MTDYTIQPARYAKNMMAVHCPSSGLYKTRAMYLAEYFARDRFSGRESAYIMSRAAAAKFEAHYLAGWDAKIMTRELIAPRP
jgi:hypothetical protein